MAEELLEIRRQWEKKAERVEGTEKAVAHLIIRGLCYNSPGDREGRVNLEKVIQYARFAPPALELKPGLKTCPPQILIDLEEATAKANEAIDQASMQRAKEAHSANTVLIEIAESFGKRAKRVGDGFSTYYIISARKPAKSKAPKRRRKEE